MIANPINIPAYFWGYKSLAEFCTMEMLQDRCYGGVRTATSNILNLRTKEVLSIRKQINPCPATNLGKASGVGSLGDLQLPISVKHLYSAFYVRSILTSFLLCSLFNFTFCFFIAIYLVLNLHLQVWIERSSNMALGKSTCYPSTPNINNTPPLARYEESEITTEDCSHRLIQCMVLLTP